MITTNSKAHAFGKYVHHEWIRFIAIGIIFVFSILPLVILLFNISGEDLSFVFSDERFGKSVLNSFLYTLASSAITTVLAVVVAYFLNESNLKHKNVFVLLITLGMLVPTISIGLGVRVLFGTNGLLDRIFNINIDGLGFEGLIIGSVISSFPATFLIIYDALKYEDKSPYDSAEIMGISKFSSFFRLKLRYLFVPIVAAFFASFTLIFSDYGIPMELQGKVNTLPMYLYEQIMSMFKYGRGSIVGVMLLLPAIASFVFDIFFKEDNVGVNQNKLIKPSKRFDIISLIIIILVCVLLFIPQLSFIILSFVKDFPNDMSFTLDNIKAIFSSSMGIGLGRYVLNSILVSSLTAIFGTAIAFITAYLSSRHDGRTGKIINLLAKSTIAIPGIVLGLGYIILFKWTNGWFFGIFVILVVVNIFHFMGTPFIMAKNCLSKMDRNYEVVGNTLGISRTKIILKVLIPNSIQTIIEMISYFFINSMITISAVAFLCQYANQPLAVSMIGFEKQNNYEMQAVISFVILLINIIFKIIINVILKFVNSKKKDNYMDLTRYQFELLTYLEKNGKGHYSQRALSDILTLSLGTINKLINELLELDYISYDSNNELSITEKGLKALDPYKVRKAIILAAGFGSRMAPVTLDTPKPMVVVNGKRIIDTLLDALIRADITNITIVRGYKKEKFDELLEKYPFIKFVDNENFNVMNNISSAMKVIDLLDRCYICEADLVISNPDIIRKYEYSTNYLAAKVTETDDWCFKKTNGYISSYQQGGTDCYQAYGISYWTMDDCEKLRNDIQKVFNSRGGKEYLWENIPLKACKKNYKIEIRKCHKTDIVEIDNFSELVQIDDSYKNYPGHEQF